MQEQPQLDRSIRVGTYLAEVSLAKSSRYESYLLPITLPQVKHLTGIIILQ